MTASECKFVGECGSCTLNLSYDEQVEFKKKFIKEKFSEFYGGEFEFFASVPTCYRSRAEFGIYHDKDKLSYYMRGDKRKFVLIDECLKVEAKIANLMQPLLNFIEKNENLKHKLFGIEFISTKDSLLAMLLYHKKLDGLKSEFDELANKFDISVIARSRGQKLVSGSENLSERLYIEGKEYKFSFSEGAFIQPNRAVNEKMISWTKGCVHGANDLLEMYCGHGNFTIPLASEFNQVLATEISKKSIANALKNCELNEVKNIKFIRVGSEELMQAFSGVREFRRLEGVNLKAFNFSHILVDPPRAGLDMSVINFIKNYENIIYISCNPETLKENLKELDKSHEAVKFAIFDQFANTTHIECGVLLRRRSANS
ncbi:tRNA (uridine(54)-C5)-methyltransferase TrmA [Campylobacter sp. CCUG 57310]|uniref:tRNA (uridine(54)-C5)-methyltransferase TrmA n=1 Tax=Campylobacter sp. CCUG 57310 TaxID=2517362 RepID=UPI00156724EB|nr:tRNA (uridine(54)-C5)-methyltransferase TrmA [Campylobacter sp. CCUG 57310]QKF92149.1 tRNA m5U54 methyltransferase [Campylobacter sp. CCUG 57310]